MRNNARKYYFLLGIILLITSCSKVPKDIISEKEMQKILVDMMVAESMINTNVNTFREDTTRLALYESIFEKHNITRALYDSSLVWYGQNLDIFMKVYDRVVVDIDRMILNLGDIQADAAPVSNSDSINIWPRRPSLTLQPNSVFNGTTFDIKPPTSYSSGSSFVLGLKVWGLTDQMAFTPEVRLSAVHNDTIITTKANLSENGDYQIIVRTHPTKPIRRVFGYIWMNNAQNDYFKIYVDDISLMKYNYGSPALKLESDSISVISPSISMQNQ